ncbi:ATPase family AAA domain-containing protein 2B-like isoform X1 [Biomphalaria glabrata]|nr:ATPase family AAA domain-containing protein 2B-like isoform X1 [Biomphalaria glabrata]
MVKTRHSVDIDVETPPKFLSLSNEKNRLSNRISDAVEKQSTRAYGNQSHDYNIFEEKVVESRLRPRIGPGRAYNYLDEDSSDEGSIQRQAQHLGYTRSRQVKQEMLDKHEESLRGNLRSKRSFQEDADQSVEDEDENDDDNVIQKRILPRLRKDSKEDSKDRISLLSKKKYNRKSNQSDDDEGENLTQGLTARQQQASEDDDDEAENLIRRSSRTRRQVYDTLNQSYLVNLPGQRKRTTNEQDHSDAKDQDDSDDNEEFSDMYSRVKRKRVRVKRNMYGMPVTEDSDSGPELRKRNKNNNKDDDGFETESEDEEGDVLEKEDAINNSSRRVTRQQNVPVKKKEPVIVKSYSLREHKPRTDLYKAPLEERKVKKIHSSIFIGTPTKKNASQTYHSPAQRRNIRKRSAFHSSSSSTSSSDGESSDEKSFKHRKAKSMAKARNRLMPLNYSTNALPPSNIVIDRIRSGASLADVEPMTIDRNITFSSIGGLGKHIQSLKEMVVFPLLYDKVFQRFNVDPPRGVLFYGPPGTGKTLVARALANECSKGDRRVAFFMRKGADCLSKWVGESERQLRILFDQAYKFRPSIIFFDEIDGLAPVRSSRQDQIHSSIVSTLLALMDGLDNRGEIVVIGATNRIDSLDPALRRPGRFDREFLFPLPSSEARKQILKIHTESWKPKLNDHFITELAGKCVGYCGADLKALCTEATMLALRRRYPQIYMTNDALKIDATSINVSAKDFFDAVGNIIPTSQRSVSAPSRALPSRVQPLLQGQLDAAFNVLKDIFSPCVTQSSFLDAAAMPNQAQLVGENDSLWDDLISDEDENSPSIFVPSTSSKGKALRKSTEETTSTSKLVYLNFARPATRCPLTFRPRLMLVGRKCQGQTTYIAPAIIHKMENFPVHVLNLPALYAVTAKTPEESCANVFQEAKRKCPSIIYLPNVNQWWDSMAETLRATLLSLIQDIDPCLPLLLLATSEQSYDTLDTMLQELFCDSNGEVIEMRNPNADERRTFFSDLLVEQACKPPPQKKKAGVLLPLVKKTVSLNKKDNDPLLSKVHSKICRCKKADKGGRKRKHSSASPLSKSSKKVKVTKCSRSKPKQNSSRTHTMTLRPRANIGKLNRNQSAKEFDHIGVDNSFSVLPCYSSNPRTKSELVFNDQKYNQDIQQSKNWKLARKGFSMTSRYERYFYRSLRAELKSVGSCTLSKLCTWAAGTKGDNQLQHSSNIKSYDLSVLSCGSSQMLYKENSDKSDNSELLRKSTAQMLPLNLKDLENSANRILSHTSSSTSQGCKDTSHTTASASQSCKDTSHTTASTSQGCKDTSHTTASASQGCKDNNFLRSTPSRICYNLRHNSKEKCAQRMLEVLPKAEPPKPTELTKQELDQLLEKEELTLMELRIFLRDVLNKLGSDKKFSIFAKPVNIENAPDYYDIIEHPMDLSTMMSRIDLHEYGTVRAFMDDIDLICSNALEYNPNRGAMDRIIRHRACALKDTAYAILKTELDKDFEKTCVEIEESRKRRGHKSSTVPNFYYTKPQSQQMASNKSQSVTPNYLENAKQIRSIPKPEGERFSRRVRGLNTDPVPPLEAVEKVFKLSRLSASTGTEESKTNDKDTFESNSQPPVDCSNKDNLPISSNQAISSANAVKLSDNKEMTKAQSSSSSASKLKKKKDIWCKPRRKRPKCMIKSEDAKQVNSEMDIDLVKQSNVPSEVQSPSSSHQISQQLRIDTTELEISESKEDKSNPSGRSSVRLKSPEVSPNRVVTRRSSMSPTNCVLKSTDPGSTHHKQDKIDDSILQVDQMKQTEDRNHLGLKRQTSIGNETHEKPSAVKRLDLEAVALDSGVGSSVESNGDSRDSIDNHKTEALSKQTVQINTKQTVPVFENSPHDNNQNCNSDLKNADTVCTVTDESKKEFVIDKNRLTALLNVLVSNTEGFNVEKLERIYCQLTSVIFHHRHNYNRLDMIEEMEKKVQRLIKVKQFGPSTSSKK